MTWSVRHASKSNLLRKSNAVTLHPWSGIELQIGKPRGAIEEAEVDRADRTVTMLGDDDLGDALLFRVFFVLIFAINKDNDVRILLD